MNPFGTEEKRCGGSKLEGGLDWNCIAIGVSVGPIGEETKEACVLEDAFVDEVADFRHELRERDIHGNSLHVRRDCC
jgi:hypothetical protein